MTERMRTRVISRKGVVLTWGGGSLEGETANLSLKGCFVAPRGGARPSVGGLLRLAIRLQEGAPDLDIEVEGVAVRSDADGVAVEFTRVSPEGFPRLLRLVQHNAPDPEGIESEMGRCAFGKGRSSP